MIPANELRIGNYHKSSPISHPRLGITSIKISGDYFAAIASYGIYLIDQGKMEFDPLPLTEEWLIELGFKKDKEKGRHGYRYSIQHQDFRYVISKDWRETTSHHFGIWYTDSPLEADLTQVYSFTEQIKYVHELQNLYFALTKEELIYKNKE